MRYLRVKKLLLKTKQINNLARQNPARSGRIRNPRATRKTTITTHSDMHEREDYRWSEPSRSPHLGSREFSPRAALSIHNPPVNSRTITTLSGYLFNDL